MTGAEILDTGDRFYFRVAPPRAQQNPPFTMAIRAAGVLVPQSDSRGAGGVLL